MHHDGQTEDQLRAARRGFLASCGKFAVATPVATTLLLAAARQNYATAQSVGFEQSGQGNNGFGNGGNDGVPGNSDFQNDTR